MNRSRIRRFLGLTAAGALTLAALGAVPASAATPGWTASNAESILPAVGPGKDAGYRVTIVNDGPGNIATLYLKSSQTPSYAPAPCNQSGPLFCNLGALTVGDQITLIVAFQVPDSGSSFTANFSISTNGATDSDGGKKKSRGDDFEFSASTDITTGGGDFDAGFVVGADVYSTNQSVGRRNIQATQLAGAPQLTTVTIQDGVTNVVCDDLDECSRLIGEWSVLKVGDGTVGPFMVTILIYGNAVTGNPDPADLFLVHKHDDGSSHVIDTACTFAGGVVTNADCLAGASKVGRNYQIVAWLAHNGTLRGGF